MTKQEQTLSDVCADAWQARRFILSGMTLGLLAAWAFFYSAVPYYRAQMIISPASPMNGAEVSSLLADDSLFALRYLVQRAGVANSSDFMRFENIYDGASVATYLLKDEQIRAGLDEDRSSKFKKPKQAWRAEELAEYIGKRVRLEPVGATPLRRMVYLHPNREFATYFLYNIHRMSDEIIRLKIKNEATQRVKYLNEAVGKTANPDHRRALTTLLLEQERLLMLVSIETPYAAAVVEAPSAGVKAAWPQAWLVYPALAFAGALAGFVLYGFSPRQAQRVQVENPRRRWFRTDSTNTNDSPFDIRDAAE
jgi:hypothetical protein